MFSTDALAISSDEKSFYERHRSEAETYLEMCKYFDIDPSGEVMLDVGGGYGNHLPWIANCAAQTFVVDIINYASDEKFSAKSVMVAGQKYGGDFDLSKVQFHTMDAQELAYRESYFDILISINAFEHISSPILSMFEILRVAKPGAKIFIQFDPIWRSPFGHHLWHLGFDPWQHLISTEEEFVAMIYKQGGTAEDEMIFKNGMNRLPYSYYSSMFNIIVERFSLSNYAVWAKDESEESHILHPNYQRCIESGYCKNDLIVRGVQFFGVKR